VTPLAGCPLIGRSLRYAQGGTPVQTQRSVPYAQGGRSDPGIGLAWSSGRLRERV